MKVLFLARRFYPEIGGVEKHVDQLSRVLNERGHSVAIITETPHVSLRRKPGNYHSVGQSDTHYISANYPVKSSQSEFFVDGKTTVHRWNLGKNNKLKKFRIWLKMLTIIGEIRRADVVHCHDVFIWYLPLRFLLPTKKVFTTFHGYEGYPLKKKDILIRKITELLSHGNISVGKFIEKWYGTSADKIIYGAVEKSKKYPKINRPIALFYGRLDDQTGILDYVKAAGFVEDQNPDFRLDVMGEGKYRKKVEKYVKRGFESNTSQILAKYRFAFLSRYLSMLEAMMLKKLVFALYDNPIKRDYLEMSPFKKFVVICGSAEELAEKLFYYIRHPQTELRLTESAYLWAKDQTWEKVADVYLKLWKKP